MPEDRGALLVKKVRADINRHGWSDMSIFPVKDHEGEPWNYSVGLSETCNHPELCIVGMRQDQAHSILWSAVNLIKDGTVLEPDTYVDKIIERWPIAILEVSDIHGHDYPLSMAVDFYGEVPANQLVWPDMEGRFPWQDGFDERYREQQVLLGAWRGD
jgi:hypothetical protein